MKDVWFDGRFINPTRPDGITSFSLGLVGELSRLMPVTVLIHLEAQRDLMPENVSVVKVNDPTSLRELTLAKRLNQSQYWGAN